MKKGGGIMIKSETEVKKLLRAISRRDKYAEIQLINLFKRDAFFIAQSFYDDHKNSGISLDEYYSVTLAEIIPAAKKFRFKRKAKFIYFYTSLARNALRLYDQSNSYMKGARPFAGDISLDMTDEDDTRPVAEELGDIDPSIKGFVDAKEIVASLGKAFKYLTETEKRIYLLYIQGNNMKTISRKLKIPLSTTYRILDSVISLVKGKIRR